MSYLINTRQRAEAALRKQNLGAGRNVQNELYPAIVVAVNGDGYDVATRDAAGNVGAVYERVFPHPVGSTLEVNDEVWLWLPSNSDDPVILVAGGGGATGCDVAPTMLGGLVVA